MNSKHTITAAEFVAMLRANTDMFYSDLLTFSEFSVRNAALWRRIQSDTTTEAEVLRLLREAN